MEAADQTIAVAVSSVKRAAKPKPVESLDDARDRLIQTVKLTPDEVSSLDRVIDALGNGSLERIKTGKLTKKETFVLVAQLDMDARERKKQYVLTHRPDNYWVIQDEATLRKLDEMLHDEVEIGADTETTGLDLYNDQIVGWSFYLPQHNVAAYVPFAHTTGQRQVSADFALTVARRHLETRSLPSIWHNYSYDGHLFLNAGIEVRNPHWDTKVVGTLLNEHESHRLKDLHAKYILGKPDEAIMYEDLFDDATIYDKDVILAGIYAAGDPHKTYQLYQFQKPHIDTRDNLRTVWYQIEQPLLGVDLRLERTGFRIDVDRMRELEQQYTPLLADVERDVLSAFNIDARFLALMGQNLGTTIQSFNFQSPRHLAYLLYDVLGCDPKTGKRFKKGERSTAADVIDALADEHEHLAPLLRYRTLQKIVTTYLRKIPEAMEPATGRLHCRFVNAGGDDDGNGGTATGRYSSSSYCKAKNSKTGSVDKGSNLQNLPSRSAEGVEVRKCFVPDDGWVFVSSDLSQIEPRIISHILFTRHGDGGMRQLYLEERDLYTEMAMFTFGLDREFCVDGAYDPTHTFKPRKLMKQGVLATLYGQSAKSFARQMHVTDDVATSFFEGMARAYPGLQPFRESVIRDLDRRGSVAYAETLYGRKRRFPTYRQNKAELAELESRGWRLSEVEKIRRSKLWGMVAGDERRAINAIIQGSAADVLKQSMIRLDRYCVGNGYKFHASIHDEIMTSVPLDKLTPQLIADIDDIMSNTVELSLPLACDTVISPRWMSEYHPEDWDFENGRPKTSDQEVM